MSQFTEGSIGSAEGSGVGIAIPLPRPRSLDGVPGERLMRLESIMRGTSRNTSIEHIDGQKSTSGSGSDLSKEEISFSTPNKKTRTLGSFTPSSAKKKKQSLQKINENSTVLTNSTNVSLHESSVYNGHDLPSSNRSITEFFNRSDQSPLTQVDVQRARCDLEAREALLRQREVKAAKRENELKLQLEQAEEHAKLVVSDTEARFSRCQQELEHYQTELEAFKENSSTALISLLRDIAEKEKAARYDQVLRDNVAIGYLSTRRHGLSYQTVEMWEDGELFIQLKDAISQLTEEKEEIDMYKKLLIKKKSNVSNISDENERALMKQEIIELDEILRFRSTMWKTESAKASIQERDLMARRLAHKSMTRILYDEKNSRYNHHPVLNSRYLLYYLVGKGGFSEVYKAYDIMEHCFVAVKLHEINSRWSVERKENFVRHAHRETKILQSLDHPRVVKCFDIFLIDNNTLATVLEFCEGEDLDAFLKREGTLCERSARCIMIQLFRGLRYLSSQEHKIIHYDLKPSNILFHKGEIKIADFGLSKLVEDQTDRIENTSPGYGSYWYLPPECFAPQEGHAAPMISSKVDIWSAGIIFYQLLYGKRPVGHEMAPGKELIDSIMKATNGFAFPTKPSISDGAKNFILRCVAFDPKDRPCIDGIFEDPYFASNKSFKRKNSI